MAHSSREYQREYMREYRKRQKEEIKQLKQMLALYQELFGKITIHKR